MHYYSNFRKYANHFYEFIVIVKDICEGWRLFHWVPLDSKNAHKDAYISFLDGEFHIISSLQGLQISFKLTVVEENLLNHISSLNESKGLLQNTTEAYKKCSWPEISSLAQLWCL